MNKNLFVEPFCNLIPLIFKNLNFAIEKCFDCYIYYQLSCLYLSKISPLFALMSFPQSILQFQDKGIFLKLPIEKLLIICYKKNMQNKIKNQGLTLVEVAIVLVILGLLIGLGASLIGPLTKRAKLQETRDIVKQAKESFLGYAVKNGFLPQEGTYDNSTPVQAFQDVGTKGRDAWGKPLRYIAANEIEGSSVYVCDIYTTSLTIDDRGTFYSNIAFIIISGGENYNIQTENTIYETGTPNIDDYPYDNENNMPRREDYDDIVDYVYLDKIRALVGCPKFRITTEFLHYGYKGSQYGAQLSVANGFPNYTWNISGLDKIEGLLLLTSGNCTYDSVTLTCDNASPCICGTPENYGTFPIKIEVTDSKNQTATKNLSLTINPSGGGGGGGCIAYRAWNLTGATRDFTVSGTCRNNRGNNAEITTTTITLNSGGSISRHASTVGNCTSAIAQTLTYDQAVAADTDRDCLVNFTLSGFTDR